MRSPIIAAAAVLTLAGCGTASRPLARDPQTGCLAAASAVIRSAPPSADDSATGPWLGRLDYLRDVARKAGDVTSRQLAAELDWAGAQVALDDFPPQLAIVPAQETCSVSNSWLSAASASPGAIAAARAWLQASAPAARQGMAAGIITGYETRVAACPASHGSAVAAGSGCEAWSVTLATAAGTLRASCGSIARGIACTSATALGSDPYYPGIGDELYVPDGGQVTGTADISIISQPPWGAF
jgi:hypothetical protein